MSPARMTRPASQWISAIGMRENSVIVVATFHAGDDALACRVLGAMTMEGLGVARDPKRGAELLQRACDRKDDEGCRALLTALGMPFRKDSKEKA